MINGAPPGACSPLVRISVLESPVKAALGTVAIVPVYRAIFETRTEYTLPSIAPSLKLAESGHPSGTAPTSTSSVGSCTIVPVTATVTSALQFEAPGRQKDSLRGEP